MNISKIVVRAGRTFNHPYESYSNLKPEVELTADLAEGEDATAAVKRLQAYAEGAVEDHKQGLLKSIHELHQLSERTAEVQGLQRQLEQAQTRLNTIREEHPELKLLVE